MKMFPVSHPLIKLLACGSTFHIKITNVSKIFIKFPMPDTGLLVNL